MEKKKIESAVVQKKVDQQVTKKDTLNNPTIEKQNIKKKKKQNSALEAASKASSAVSQVDAHAYKDGSFANSGSNLTYREGQ
jgi:hypothetical protein